MEILSIEPSEKKKYIVNFDMADSLQLYYSEIKGLNWKQGNLIAESEYAKAVYEVIGKRAIRYAMHILEKRDKTEAQLRMQLRQKEYPKAACDRAVEYVKSYHYLDDEEYCRKYIEYRAEAKSRRNLKMELLGKGVSAEIIEAALEEYYDGNERAQITALLQKRHYDPGTADAREKQRQMAFLLRRGYSMETIHKAIDGLTDV